MGLFQNRPQTSDPVNYVTIGMNKTMLIVGLGNIGAEYDGTRHNIGFACVDAFARTNTMDAWILKKDLKCHLSSGRIGEVRVFVMKPTTFMNLSGEAVQAVAAFYKIPLTNILIVHDELDVDFGQLRLRVGGSAAGHNGIKSVSQHMTEDYGRIRIGIGPKHPARIPSEKFVLQAFSTDEQTQIPNLTQEVNAILSEYVYGGTLPTETRSFLV
jgi:PTH1 family peptidyl-tRNA hydrolase